MSIAGAGHASLRTAVGSCRTRSLDYRASSGCRARRRASSAEHAPVTSRRQERAPAQAAHRAHRRRHRRRDHGVRPAAHDRRRLVRRAPMRAPARGSSRATRFRSSSRCRSPTRRRSGRCRACARCRGPTGSAASTSAERNFFPQFAIDPRDAISPCIRSSASPRTNARVPARPQRRDRRPQARRSYGW